MGNWTFLVHSTGEYSHSFPHSMDSCWWAYLFSPPGCPFDKLSVHSPLKGQVYDRSLSIYRLFHCLFDGTQELHTEQDYLQCSYTTHLFEEVDWSTLAGYHHRLHLKVPSASPLTDFYRDPTSTPQSLLHFSLSFPVCGCAPCWIPLDTLLHCSQDGGKPAGTIFTSLKCGSMRSVKTLSMDVSPCP